MTAFNLIVSIITLGLSLAFLAASVTNEGEDKTHFILYAIYFLVFTLLSSVTG